MAADDTNDGLEALPPDRRSFIKRLAIGAAFATPVVSSFAMNGLSLTSNTAAGSIVSNQSAIPSDFAQN